MNPNITALLTEKIDSFPTLPTVVTRVMQVTADPKSSTKDLLAVISPDQSLTMSILKMANSAFFGLPREISSLQQALTILGFKEIQNLVLAKAVFNSFKNVQKNGPFDINKFWEHSFLCGLLSKIIANDIKKDNNEFFVAGLIHDIGKLIIFLAIPREFYRIIQTPTSVTFRMFQEEQHILGLTHGEIGMKLLKRWLFPETLITAVGFHHSPHEVENHTLFSLVVYLADLLTYLENSTDDNENAIQLEESLFHPDTIRLLSSFGLEWNESALQRIQQELARCKEEEAGVLNMLLA
jgi:HD-like signal output (HDOD) protein